MDFTVQFSCEGFAYIKKGQKFPARTYSLISTLTEHPHFRPHMIEHKNDITFNKYLFGKENFEDIPCFTSIRKLHGIRDAENAIKDLKSTIEGLENNYLYGEHGVRRKESRFPTTNSTSWYEQDIQKEAFRTGGEFEDKSWEYIRGRFFFPLLELKNIHRDAFNNRLVQLFTFGEQIGDKGKISFDAEIILEDVPKEYQATLLMQRMKTLKAYLTEDYEKIPALEEEFKSQLLVHTNRR
jgi:hypothetical protein